MRGMQFTLLPILLLSLSSPLAISTEWQEILRLPDQGSNCRFDYGVSPEAVLVTVLESDHFRLHLGVHRSEEISQDEVHEKLTKAITHVEKVLGRFRHTVQVFVADSIQPIRRGGTSGRVVAVCYKADRNIIVLSKDRLTLPIITHEFVHAWFNEQAREPESWVEEGIAEYIETLEADGYSEFHVARLKELGFLDFERFGKTQVCTPERRLARSSSYWMVYHLVQAEKYKLAEVPRFVSKDQYAEAARAFASLTP